MFEICIVVLSPTQIDRRRGNIRQGVQRHSGRVARSENSHCDVDAAASSIRGDRKRSGITPGIEARSVDIDVNCRLVGAVYGVDSQPRVYRVDTPSESSRATVGNSERQVRQGAAEV